MFRYLMPLLLAFAPFGALAADEAPDAMVKRIADEVVAVVKTDKDLKSGNSAKVVELAEQKVLPHFDFTRMTRLAVGRNWRQAKPEQREALTKEFRTLLVRTYSSSLSQYRDQKIQVKPLQMSPSDEDVVVRTAILQENGPQIPIDYRMEKTKEGWKVYDVVIDGASLVTTYRGSFNDQIQRGGIDALVKTLQERNRGPQPAKASREVSAEATPQPAGDVLRLTGALDFESLPGVLVESEKYIARPELPERLTIDFSDVSAVDSSAVALLLEWLRRAREKGVALEFANLPPNLLALAELYGVRQIIEPPPPGAAP